MAIIAATTGQKRPYDQIDAKERYNPKRACKNVRDYTASLSIPKLLKTLPPIFNRTVRGTKWGAATGVGKGTLVVLWSVGEIVMRKGPEIVKSVTEEGLKGLVSGGIPEAVARGIKEIAVQTVKEVARGAAEGALVGGVFAFIGGVSESHFKNYNQWLKVYKLTETLQDFENLHDTHPLLQELLRDPITFSFMVDPVRTPWGVVGQDIHVYDRSTIEILSQRSNRAGRLIDDPLRNGTFSMDQVENAPDILGRLNTVYVHILTEEAQNPTLTPGVKAGLEALAKDLKSELQSYFQNERDRLNARLDNQEITLAQWSQEIQTLHARLFPQVPGVANPDVAN
jgi:hypothetical protein